MESENNIYVINLDKRPDKMEHINNMFEKYFKINRIDAVYREEGWRGCLLSHIKCIKYAKENNLKYIMVMEDDCVDMCPNWYERIMKIKKEVFDKKNDWDIFLGGSLLTQLDNISKYDFEYDNIYNISNSTNTHFIVYNHTSYDYILQRANFSGGPIDVLWWYNLKCLMPVPFIFKSAPSISDIAGRYVDHTDMINNNEKKLLTYIKNNNIA